MPRKSNSSPQRVRNNKGRFALSPNSPKALWNKPGALGFAHWVKEISPRILTSVNRYEVFNPTRKQADLIKKILEADDNGRFIHSLSLQIAPRRHGKSLLYALICLWLFTSRENLTIQLLGNHEIHCRRTMYRTLKRIIRHTPKLSKIIPDKNILSYEIKYKSNIIQMGTTNVAGSFGDKLDILWCSDLHSSPDLEPFNAFQAALLDSESSLCLIDSNVDHTDGHVHSLQRQAEQDSGIFCDHTHYRDLDHYLKDAPLWINRQKAKRLQSTTLPADFARDILGKRLDAKNALFPSNVISLCKSKYQIPVTDISELTQGRTYKVGSGLDRSKSLFGGDNTVWTVVLKVASPKHGEPEFYILNQQVIIPNTSRMIKKAILKDHERYSLDKVTLENYEVTDIASWLSDQRIPFELVSAHNTNQNISFTEFYRIAKEGRFHYSAALRGLTKEMQTFSYTQKTGGVYSFGHSSHKFKDDRVYSVNWAIFSIRDAVMNLYTLGNILCKNKSARRHMCTLMGGDLVLLCSESCQAFQEVDAMFKEFKQYQLDSELTIPEFFETKVKLEGARISQAA